MTRRQLERRYEALSDNYDRLVQIVVALARKQGALYVERALVDDQNHEWVLQSEPTNGGEAAIVTAVHKSTAGQTAEASLAIN